MKKPQQKPRWVQRLPACSWHPVMFCLMNVNWGRLVSIPHHRLLFFLFACADNCDDNDVVFILFRRHILINVFFGADYCVCMCKSRSVSNVCVEWQRADDTVSSTALSANYWRIRIFRRCWSENRKTTNRNKQKKSLEKIQIYIREKLVFTFNSGFDWKE